MVLDDSFDYLVTNNNEVIDLYKINNIKTTNYSLIVFNKPFVDQNLISNVEDNEEYDISVLDNFEQLKEFLKNINENKTIQLLN
jgi:CRISPR/Cas system CMR subunit Cmr4 (Cas7 group RAMP superfamily)